MTELWSHLPDDLGPCPLTELEKVGPSLNLNPFALKLAVTGRRPLILKSAVAVNMHCIHYQRPDGLYSSALQYSSTVAYVLLKARPGSEGMNP